MKIKIYPFIALIAMLALTACHKSSSSTKKTSVGPTTDVYVAGYTVAPDNKNIAVYWKNGVAHPLTDGSNYALVFGIAVSGNDVYVVGYRASDTLGVIRAVYWKNGVAQILDANPSEACAIAVKGNDVYVTGFLVKNTKFLGVLWKNGIATVLPDDSLGSLGLAITLNGDDVYIAGSTATTAGNGHFIATYWKNNIPVKLYSNNNSSTITQAQAIAVTGSNVYVAGVSGVFNTDTTKAIYWNNGTATYLTSDNLTNSNANAIALQNNDVYIAGTRNGTTRTTSASYWKNGTPVDVDISKNSYLFGIAVQGTDVYVAGQKDQHPMYWKNGVATTLSQSIGSATGIVVVQNSN